MCKGLSRSAQASGDDFLEKLLVWLEPVLRDSCLEEDRIVILSSLPVLDDDAIS